MVELHIAPEASKDRCFLLSMRDLMQSTFNLKPFQYPSMISSMKQAHEGGLEGSRILTFFESVRQEDRVKP